MNNVFDYLIEKSEKNENAKIDGVKDTDQVILDKRTKKQKETEKAVKEGLARLIEMSEVIEEAAVIQIKKYSDTFLYSKGDYNKNIFEFMMKADEINKKDPSFDDIKFMVKRQAYQYLVNIMDSDNVVLLTRTPKSMPRSFKVFCAKDVRHGSGQTKVFIDVTGVITMKDGQYTMSGNKLNELVSYLTSAFVYQVYNINPAILLRNAKLIDSGTRCFALLFTHIIDYLRMGGVDNIRAKSLYLSAIYYQKCVLNNVYSDDVVKARAKNISGLSSREIDVIEYQLKKESFDNIDTFVNTVAEILKIPSLKIDNFVEKWVFLYKSGTQFALEYYPAFSSMLTNAFHGGYLNNQQTIEKVLNNGRDLVDYCRVILQLGSEMV